MSFFEKNLSNSSIDFRKPSFVSNADEGKLLEFGICPDCNPGLGSLASPINLL